MNNREYQKKYRETHKEIAKDYQKEYYEKHKNKLQKQMKIYRDKYKSEAKEYQKKYRLINKENIKKYKIKNKDKFKIYYDDYNKKYYLKNRENVLKQKKEYFKISKNKLIKNLRNRIIKVLRGINKSKSTIILVGCSIEYLKQHLEKQFKEGMSFSNYGLWHIDHIKPCVSFDFSKPEEQRKCFHYTNLQPLWAKDNLSKGAK